MVESGKYPNDLKRDSVLPWLYRLPTRESRSHVQYIYLMEALCPRSRVGASGRLKLAPDMLPELLAKRRTHSLRQLAKEYRVSHETIRSRVSPD